MFWMAMLVGYFGLLWKMNLMSNEMTILTIYALVYDLCDDGRIINGCRILVRYDIFR